MNTFTFNVDWIEQIRIIEEHGTKEDREFFWNAIFTLATGVPMAVPENAVMGQLALIPMRDAIEKEYFTSEQRKQNGAKGGKAKQTLANDSKAKQSDSKTKQTEAKEKEREREEREEENGESREASPYNPLEESKEDKGEEIEEKEKERDIYNIYSSIADVSTDFALPEPQFVAESDPKKMTDKVLEEEFDALWMLYPRKAGKADALRHYKAARKKGVAYDTIEDGVRRYADSVRNEDPKYIAMGSTWFNGHRWEDQYVRKKTALEKLWDL